MDITVHCDIGIFEWLMRWVKKSANVDGIPLKVDAENVVPLVVSAEFFQMAPLFEDCLVFFRHNITEILEKSTKLHYLNDNIISRLAEMFSNTELEELNDPKGKLKNKLFCKLIATLAAPTPDMARGHFASLANLYKCVSCGKLMQWHFSDKVPCHPKNVHVDICGKTESRHVRDTSWSLSEHVKQLRRELHSWRAVYWRLWGECHFLRCSACKSSFPVHQARWCLHHPKPPQFFPAEQHSTAAYPVGRYPCCGERAYRFEVLPHQSGCQFKNHTLELESICDSAVHNVFLAHMEQIAVEPPQLMFPERITYFISPSDCSDPSHSGNRKEYWWEGLELAPAHPAPSNFLSKSWVAELLTKDAGNDHLRLSTEVDSDEDQSRLPRHLQHRVVPSSQVVNKTPTGPPQWIPGLSTRQNQDNQREYEECAMQRIAATLTRRICGEAGAPATMVRRGGLGHRKWRWSPHVTPPGGTYMRLEQEWKEAQILEKRSQNLYYGHHRLDGSLTPSSTTGIPASALYHSRLRSRGHLCT
ncbi:SANT and BTB domain regulator of class switch recombination [Schistocerca gregaria]|uniref:SANT and BTB domain regulator of class switch recombination n=1 Tax=Schistocerca gregaria TaxID=7010 RepID=UPI00211E039B|nr:SANT and BTB domain regulator of class switch recombination [Schistocerca gregaria]